MRRFLITSKKFDGTAELFYNDKGTLCKIDLTNTGMDEMIVQQFKKAAPATLAKMKSAFSSETMVVEADFDLTFEVFWKEYPLHRNKFKVVRIWNKMNKTDQVKAFASLHAYKKYLTKNEWQSPMIADRYLRDREFETEWQKI
jgi:hypothetical protein